ncbi:hypothetical protein IJD34_07545 [bacterium]|nr:hypothetical protein [bacterium]
MQINSVQNYSINKQQTKTPQFKSAYPVYHWVKDVGEQRFAPAVTHTLNKQLQGKLVRLFNGTSRFSATEAGRELIEKLKASDFGYRFNQITRSYYDHKGGWEGKFRPINYLITGNDVEKFDKEFGKPIGKANALSPKINGKPSSAEHDKAINDYLIAGLNFVKGKQRQIVDTYGTKYGLHTKIEVIRNSKGKIKEYRISDIKFCPETGNENPFVRMGYYNPEHK